MIFLTLIAFLSLSLPPEPSEWRPLLEKDRLDAWDVWLGRPHASDDLPGLPRDADGGYLDPIGAGDDRFEVFTLIDTPEGPTLRVSGRIFGFIATKESFSNYHLRLQVKWGEQKWAPRSEAKRDSGLLYHVVNNYAEPRRSFPRSIELQIQEQDTGDLYAVNMNVKVRARQDEKGQLFHDPAEPIREIGVGTQPRRNRCTKQGDYERPHGEWNDIELICVGGESIHIVNGHVVMRAHEPMNPVGDALEPFHHGRIALQSEGAEVFFRGLEIREIAELPPELVEKR
jgi:Domain of Unknown Function (DUF1080).